jgi:hypothetical protein
MALSEKMIPDAPISYSFDAAIGWSNGYNAALADMEAEGLCDPQKVRDTLGAFFPRLMVDELMKDLVYKPA